MWFRFGNVFQSCFSFFFALVPLSVYHIYDTAFKGGLSKKELFLAVFFVVSLGYFYAVITGVARQQLGELFLVLLLMVLFTDIKKDEYMAYNFIFILFSLALIFSQYSLANLFAFFIIIFIILNTFFIKIERKLVLTGFNYLMLYLVLSLCWNMYIAGGSVFKGMVTMGYNIIYSFSDMFAPDTNISLNIATTTSINLSHILYRYIFYFVIVCMAVGGLILLKNLITNNKNKITIPILKKFHIFRNIKLNERKNTLYEMLAFSNYSLLGLYLVVPLIGYQLGFDRVFHITTLLLAPYFIIGFKSILGVLDKLKNVLFKLKNKKNFKWKNTGNSFICNIPF